MFSHFKLKCNLGLAFKHLKHGGGCPVKVIHLLECCSQQALPGILCKNSISIKLHYPVHEVHGVNPTVCLNRISLAVL